MTRKTIFFTKKGNSQKIAGRLFPAQNPKAPLFLLLLGYGSDMDGAKASAVGQWLDKEKLGGLMFDYSGCGASAGDFSQLGVTHWKENAEAAFDVLPESVSADAPIIIIGSSMGGWLAMKLTQNPARAAKIGGALLLAPAPDFPDALILPKLSLEQKQELQKNGVATLDGLPIYAQMLSSASQENILNAPSVKIDGPVIALCGEKDESVPVNFARKAFSWLQGDAKSRFIALPESDHRLSQPKDIALILSFLEEMREASLSRQQEKSRPS